MSEHEDIELMTEQFLRENDKKFTKKNRKKTLEYSYLSSRQMRRRNGREIPLTALSQKQRNKCPNLCGEMMYGDDKN